MLLRSLFPTWWKLPPREVKQEEDIVVDWLEREIDEDKRRKLPSLEVMTGWRNREVFNYVRAWDWTKKMFR